MRRDSGKTDRYRQVFEPEDIFDRFVRNANKSTEAKLPDDDDITGCLSREALRRAAAPEPDHRVSAVGSRGASATSHPTPRVEPIEVELSQDADDTMIGLRPPRVEASPVSASDADQPILRLAKLEDSPSFETPAVPPAVSDRSVDATPTWKSIVAPRSRHTQRLDVSKVVPDVVEAAKRKTYDGPPPGETGEDGQMPTRELDQILSDMQVLLRYGHAEQVRGRLEQLGRAYPEDLLLLRRIAEFHVEHGETPAALDALFGLARKLFERRNVEGMRQALEQVLVLDPGNRRSLRLLWLLDARTDATDA